MKILKRVLIGLFLLLAIVAASIFIYLQTLKPTLSGEITFEGLGSKTEVLFDQYGVPHIYAENEEDAYAALGYVHAQDRLFQMEMLRRAAGGRLAEVLGPELLEVDKLFRTLGLNEFARKNAAEFLNADTAAYQRAVKAYFKGINKFVESGFTPLEFTLTGIPKTPFSPEDAYLAIGFMSLTFANGLQADPVLQKIHEQLGPQYLADLAIDVTSGEMRIPIYSDSIRTATDKLITALQTVNQKIPLRPLLGSNGWVVSGAKSASGFPILANDTHIAFSQPAAWYEAHLEYPGHSFYGHFLAGFPLGVLGNNRFCGWGVTMFENDDVDYFRETLNPDNAEEVKFRDSWEKLKTRREVIKVKGESDVILDVKISRHGPIINGIVDHVDAGSPVAICWQLLEGYNHDLQALYQLIHADKFADARAAASKFDAPGLNLMYGDIEGNIAWFAVAKLPIRPAHVQSKLFLDGSSGNDEYQGYYTFDTNPHAVNPPWGYVYSANNQPDTINGVLHAGYYYPATRSGRVDELLRSKEKFSFEDMKTINLDNKSELHARQGRRLAELLEGTTAGNADVTLLVGILKEWKGEHTRESQGPSVYYNMLAQLLHLAMEDELGPGPLKVLLETPIVKNSMASWLNNPASPWWDNITTKDKKESLEEILVTAATNTVANLRRTCGEPGSWNWGKIHSLTHQHPLAKVKPLDKVFNVGPFAVDGGSEVINNLDFPFSTTGVFEVNVGPALRKITDFAKIDDGQTVSPTGQSGNIMSPHYEDQAEMFVTGQFRNMQMKRDQIVNGASGKLTLIP
jgi:penicillin G amidase